MRRLAVCIALFYWLCADEIKGAIFGIQVPNIFAENGVIREKIRSVLKKPTSPAKQNENEVTKYLIKLCTLKLIQAKDSESDSNFNVTNKNILENSLKLPNVMLPNVTVIYLEDDESPDNCSDNKTTNCQVPKARTAIEPPKTSKPDMVRNMTDSETVIIKKCVLEKLKALKKSKP